MYGAALETWQNDDNLAMREPHRQQLVVNMFAVGGEDGTAADQAAQDGQRGFQNRQS